MAQIRTYARLKPTPEPYEEYEIVNNHLRIRVPEVYRDYSPSPGKLKSNICYDFKYDKIFNTDSIQEDVFNAVAHDIIEGFLNGYNGTIFAYGQTGTGKTYTVEGSARKYSERGLAPRALSMIYETLSKRQDEEITAHISYIEIYQEVAYDLLTPGARTFSPVTPFQKVTVIEGPGGTCLIRNLSVHLAASEDVAQSLLLQGQANRKVAETPVNQRSSRSHAVLTMYLAAKRSDSDVIIKSKLHLVDLAGSERVAKTGVDGHQLTEAKSINLSLHHLETVIISLQTDSLAISKLQQKTSQSAKSLNLSQSRPYTSDGFRATRHIPYRNSLLTMVLRDSLGGNCQTAMIATLSLEWRNIGETLSTCRFAQRVACIANYAIRNEEIDDQTLIRQLKRRIADLEAEIACLQSQEDDSEPGMAGKLTDEDKLFCSRVVHEYLGGRLSDPITAGITTPYKFRECFKVLKQMVMKGYFNPQISPQNKHVSSNQSKITQVLKLEDSGKNSNGAPGKPVEMWAECNGVQQQNHNMTYTVSSGQQNRSSSNGTDSSHSRNGSSQHQCSKRDDYKSPFERKREKEIQRLSKKLNVMEDLRLSREQQLSQLQHDVALQELDTVEMGVQAKLDVALDQVKDQEAYVLQLKHTEARPELLEQEKLVEKQLRKRKAKFEKKLEEIRQRKALLLSNSSGDENTTPTKTESRSTVEEKFAQCKKRNGSLNTRQVFEMLKSEEKKQSKIQTQIEKEHIMTKSRQLEIKEAATRLKLRELKEMFQRSKSDESFKSSHSTAANSQHSSMYSRSAESLEREREQEQNPHQYPLFKRTEKRLSSVNEESHLFSHSDDRISQNEMTRPSTGSRNLSSAKLFENNFHNGESSGNTKWDSAYSSRPSSTPASSNMGSEAAADVLGSCQKEEKFRKRCQENGDKPSHHHYPAKSSTSDSRLNGSSENTPVKPAPSETLIPSQYVHRMKAEESFDARKMALTSTTFDGALSSMLDEDNRQLMQSSFSDEFYNQFARSTKIKQKKHARKKISRNNLDDNMKMMMEWGPESRNSPISAKLAKYLNSDDNGEKNGHISTSRKKTDKKYRTNDDPFQSKLDEFRTSGFPKDEHVSLLQPKITAIADVDRERVFMSKAQIEKERIEKIRKARYAAEVIQRSWRRCHARKQTA